MSKAASPAAREPRRWWGLRFRAAERVQQSWLLIPCSYLVGALALGRLVPSVEPDLAPRLGVSFSQDSAADILQAVASGMLAFTGLVVSVAVVVVQFGAAQYTPRLVLRFRRDSAVKHSLGIFAAPAVFSIVSLGRIGEPGAHETPSVTVVVAMVLLISAIVAFFQLIARLLDLLRPRRLYHLLRLAGEQAIDALYPLPFAAAQAAPPLPARSDGRILHFQGEEGVLSAIDLPALVHAAGREGLQLEVLVRVGEYVRRSQPVIVVHGADEALRPGTLVSLLIVAEERTVTQDPPFALRTIVDIAIRALSPAVNDPTTAVQALDTLGSLLQRLAGRDLGGVHLAGPDGTPRVWYPAAAWEDYLDLACTEIRAYGASSHQVARRLHALLIDLLASVPQPRRPAVQQQLALLEAAVHRAHPADEAQLALAADHNGLGGRAASAGAPS